MSNKQILNTLYDSLIAKREIWLLLAWQDIKLRYRRSMIGPFWLTISMAITIYSMGFLYSKLFKIDLSQYFPYLATGMIMWQLISTLVNEACTGFISADGYLKEIPIPPLVFIIRLIYRNLLILMHNLPVYIPIMLFFHVKINANFLLFIPGLILLCINAFFYGALLAFLGARFRDLAQIITSLVQVIFFLTPIMWLDTVLPAHYMHFLQLNPFYIFINLLRSPLQGIAPSLFNYNFAIISALVGMALLSWVYPKYKSRLIYWL